LVVNRRRQDLAKMFVHVHVEGIHDDGNAGTDPAPERPEGLIEQP
jgi:hypothetical protein